jgi:hypothetical protein
MSAPIACPKCNHPLARRRALNKVIWHWCATCREDWNEEYLAAFDRCSDLQAVMYSSNYIAIKPRRGTDDAKLIKTLFDKKDKRYSWLHGWMIYNIPKYSHLKCVQSAASAFLHQYHFLEVA